MCLFQKKKAVAISFDVKETGDGSRPTTYYGEVLVFFSGFSLSHVTPLPVVIETSERQDYIITW